MRIKTGLCAAVFATALVLTGCGGSDPQATAPGPAAESGGGPSTTPGATASEPTGEQGGSGDPAAAGTDDRELPEGFPVSEIPIAAGAILSSSKGDPGGPYAYTVLVRVGGVSPTAVMKAITRQLHATGFTAAPGPATAATAIATFTSHTYDVGVNVIRAEARTTVTYVVVRKS